MDPDRRLAPGELRRVLRLASDADELATRDDDDATLAHLEEAGRAVGIPPARIRRAAAIRPDAEGGLARVFLGGADHRRLEASLPAPEGPGRADVGAVDRTAVADALARTLGRPGRIEESDEGFTWFEDHTLGRTRLVVREEDGSAEVSLSADRAGHYLLSWFGGLVGWGVLAAVLAPLGILGPIPTTVGFLAMPFLLARPWWTARDRRLRARLEAAMMEVLEVLDEAQGERPDPVGLEEGDDPPSLPGRDATG